MRYNTTAVTRRRELVAVNGGRQSSAALRRPSQGAAGLGKSSYTFIKARGTYWNPYLDDRAANATHPHARHHGGDGERGVRWRSTSVEASWPVASSTQLCPALSYQKRTTI
jgi:hypothetical protein